MAAGIAMIHQHFMLIEAMTVVENVMLGWPEAGARAQDRSHGGAGARSKPPLRSRPRPRRAHRHAAARAAGSASRSSRPSCATPNFSILDEPTSNLAPSEVADLLTILRRLRAEGKGIVFITHKLPEVLEVCDDVVVLRDGRVSGRAPVAGTTRAQLAEMMVGRDVTRAAQAAIRVSPGAVRLDGRASLTAPDLAPLTFDVRGGEILGVAGVDGNGQIELAETLAGLRRARARHDRARWARHHARAGRRAGPGGHGLHAGRSRLDRRWYAACPLPKI